VFVVIVFVCDDAMHSVDYTVAQEVSQKVLSISSPNIDGFSKLFQRHRIPDK